MTINQLSIFAENKPGTIYSITKCIADAGVDIRVLKELLGHESLSTTEIYTHVSNKQIEEASKKSPLGNVKPAKTAKKSDNG